MIDALVRRMIDWAVVLLIITLVLWALMVTPLLPTWKGSEAKTLYVDPVALRQHVTELSMHLSPRIADYDGHRPAANYIKGIFEKSAKTHNQSFVTGMGNFNNVIASYGPNTKQVIIIGAHYDAESSVPAADDNASGVAALLELSRLLAPLDKTLKVRVELVAYALGSGMLFGSKDMGSFYHAEQLRKKGKEVNMMVSIDTIGYFSNDKHSQRHPFKFLAWFYPRRGNYIEISGRIQDTFVVRRFKKSFRKASNVEGYSFNAPEVFPGLAESDNLSYWMYGYQGIRISDTSAYRNPNLNSDKDLPETLDYDKMAWVTQGVFQAINDAGH